MRIAVMLFAFHGGAAKSLMQYVDILVKEGHEVLVEGSVGTKSIADAYLKLGASIKEFDNDIYDKGKVKGLIVVGKMAEYALKWKPDCIITVGLQLSYYMSILAKKYNVKFLSIIPGGNLKSGKEKFSHMKCEHMLVFSKENRQEVTQYGFKGKVTVIANRIPVDIDEEWKQKYRSNKNDKVKLLMASRIDSDKMSSIKYVIDITKKLSMLDNNVILDIIGDGAAEAELKEYVEAVNREIGRDVVKYWGFQNNVRQRYAEADICFGKGRCLLEPAMLGRYIVCVSEDNKCSIVTSKAYDNVSFFNFSGREISCESTVDDIRNLVGQIGDDDTIARFEEVRELIINDYSAEKLYDRFYKEFFQDNFVATPENKKKKKCTNIIGILMQVFVARIRLIK